MAEGKFQSTLPAWGETMTCRGYQFEEGFQSTLPAWGETIQLRHHIQRQYQISIHSPRMGRDNWPSGISRPWRKFQSTLPAWGETFPFQPIMEKSRFQSTLPAWGETRMMPSARPCWIFQSTLPAWGETRCIYRSCDWDQISIHSPRMGRDTASWLPCSKMQLFQSTLPAWGETG